MALGPGRDNSCYWVPATIKIATQWPLNVVIAPASQEPDSFNFLVLIIVVDRYALLQSFYGFFKCQPIIRAIWPSSGLKRVLSLSIMDVWLFVNPDAELFELLSVLQGCDRSLLPSNRLLVKHRGDGRTCVY